MSTRPARMRSFLLLALCAALTALIAQEYEQGGGLWAAPGVSDEASEKSSGAKPRALPSAAFGLPPAQQFNNIVERTLFEAWMRMLQAVPGSVLWLMRGSELARTSLRQAASACGIDPGRLVFAEAMPKEAHLARHRLAGLFLDTRTINAGTTASDALWAGLPVLTCPGGTLGSRVAASLVCAVGLADLVVPDLAAYERLGIELARDASRLAGIRSRLERNRLSTPLFDTRGFVAALERAFETMHARQRSGEACRSFAL